MRKERKANVSERHAPVWEKQCAHSLLVVLFPFVLYIVNLSPNAYSDFIFILCAFRDFNWNLIFKVGFVLWNLIFEALIFLTLISYSIVIYIVLRVLGWSRIQMNNEISFKLCCNSLIKLILLWNLIMLQILVCIVLFELFEHVDIGLKFG